MRVNWMLLIMTGWMSGAVALAQGNYGPVKSNDLVGASFNHYYNQSGKAVLPADFAWSFTSTNLLITAGRGPIPPDLLSHLAGSRSGIKHIQAGWQLRDGELLISGIYLDGEPTRTMARLPVAFTAPTVIRIGEKQYVFTPRR